MKKFKISKVLLIIIVLMCIAALIFASNIRSHDKLQDMDYDKANEITKGFESYYDMTIDTILTLEDGESVKQNAISQNVEFDSDIYKVSTEATTTDVTTGAVSKQENSYMYYLGNYYYDYPGVKYTSPIGHDEAMANIENLTNIISFDYSDMVNLTKEYDDENEYIVFNFTVGYDSVSDYVKSLLQSAAHTFENVNFKPVEISASATVNKASIVEKRELYVEYQGDDGERIVIEIYTSLSNDKPKLEVPDASKYVNIEG